MKCSFCAKVRSLAKGFVAPAATGLPGTPSALDMQSFWRNFRIQPPGVHGINGGWSYNSLGPEVATGPLQTDEIR